MRARIGIYVLASTALSLAVVLAALRVGEEAGQLSGWQALVLGVVQGLTEFLPVSSSGHLILVPWLADWTYLKENDEFNATFDVGLHIGTLVAVTAYFRRDIAGLIAAWLRSVRRRTVVGPEERVAWLVALATVPAAVVGALGENFIVERLGEPWQIAIFLAVFGIVLWLADRTAERRDMNQLRYGEAIGIGFAQALSLMPGVSRSGITMSAARFLGLDRESAARFSFLLVVPTTLGAVLWKGVTDVLLADLPPGSGGPVAIGVLAAAASGFVAIDALLGYVRRRNYSPFVLYRLVVALFVAGLILSGVRDASF
ncbi:MAG: undecaprenyl-diphosphate phosphatase [Actinobacteria bacterium]|nr:undecaprenyl-diphosphate phosphatase [Actinomycetota bacterium]